MKKCTKCKIEKDLSEFSKDKIKKDGFCSSCKYCKKEHYKANKERVKERNRKYYKDNKESKKKQMKQWQQDNKEKQKEYNKQYREDNIERLKQYYKDNKEKINKRNREYEKKRKKIDPLFKLKKNLRTRTSLAFSRKGYSKNTKTQEMLGVEWEVLKHHIERQFTKGMNWNNYGEWHIDHIIPLASEKTDERLKKLCHYTNLQPMWAEENMIKQDKINGQQTLLRI